MQRTGCVGFARLAFVVFFFVASSGIAIAQNTPPEANIVIPADGATIHERIAVAASITDDGGFEQIDPASLLIDGVEAGPMLPTIYGWLFKDSDGLWGLNPLLRPNGIYELQVKAVDAQGAIGYSQVVTIVIDNPDRPSAAIYTPADGTQVVSGEIVIGGLVNDHGQTIKHVQWYWDGYYQGALRSDKSTPLVWTTRYDVSCLGPGTHTIRFVATDEEDQQGVTETVEIEIIDSGVPPYRFEAFDDVTGRPVPVVVLTQVTSGRIIGSTDSGGRAAVDFDSSPPQPVKVAVSTGGYTFAGGNEDGTIDIVPTPGGSTTLWMTRTDIAERLYRVSGRNTYCDSFRLGESIPVTEPFLNAGVLGQDSVNGVIFDGKIHWFWGDTGIQRPTGLLHGLKGTGATSQLPGQGGLQPDVGIDLTYFIAGPNNLAKTIAPLSGEGTVWLTATTVVDSPGGEVILSGYGRHGTGVHGIAMWNSGMEVFENVYAYSDSTILRRPEGKSGKMTDGIDNYAYFATPFVLVRVESTEAAATDPSAYQAFTFLESGREWGNDPLDRPAVQRDVNGDLEWSWRNDAAVVNTKRWQELEEAGEVFENERIFNLTDVDTGVPIDDEQDECLNIFGILVCRDVSQGSVRWNPYRGKWVMLANRKDQFFTHAVWYAEGDTPVGPWTYARKVVEQQVIDEGPHFYNVVQHDFFDEEGGRLIYFEGTYSDCIFGICGEDTPQAQNYNQLMYRLDLSDPDLVLPTPIYHANYIGAEVLLAGEDMNPAIWDAQDLIPFYAISPSDTYPNLIPIYQEIYLVGSEIRTRLHLTPVGWNDIAFRAYPGTDPKPGGNQYVSLYEWTNNSTGAYTYRVEGESPGSGWTQASSPLCHVWKSPAPKAPVAPELLPVW